MLHRDTPNGKDRSRSEYTIVQYNEKSIKIVNQLAVATGNEFKYDTTFLAMENSADGLIIFLINGCIEWLPLTFKEYGLDDCIQTHGASDATPNTKAHFNAAMILGVESILMTIVKFGGNDVLKSKDEVREMMSHIKDEVDRGHSFGIKFVLLLEDDQCNSKATELDT